MRLGEALDIYIRSLESGLRTPDNLSIRPRDYAILGREVAGDLEINQSFSFRMDFTADIRADRSRAWAVFLSEDSLVQVDQSGIVIHLLRDIDRITLGYHDNDSRRGRIVEANRHKAGKEQPMFRWVETGETNAKTLKQLASALTEGVHRTAKV